MGAGTVPAVGSLFPNNLGHIQELGSSQQLKGRKQMSQEEENSMASVTLWIKLSP